MSGRRYAPGRKPGWTITVFAGDRDETIFGPQACEDGEVARALAAEARHLDLRCRIFIRDPFGNTIEWA